MTTAPTMYRQGDVFLQRVEKSVRGLAEVPRENGAIVLAHGELTGHAHAIHAKNARLLTDGADRFLRVVRRTVALTHEEHAPITLPPGVYRVVRQREYHPQEIRTVAD